MICALLSKFGADLIAYDIDEKIDYYYGTRKAAHNGHANRVPQTENDHDTMFTTFLKSTVDEKVNNFIGVQFVWDAYKSYATNHGLPPITSKTALIRRINSSNVHLRRSPKYGCIQGWHIVRPKTKFQTFLRDAVARRQYITTRALWDMYIACMAKPEHPTIDSESNLIRFVNIAAKDVGFYPVKSTNKTVGWEIGCE